MVLTCAMCGHEVQRGTALFLKGKFFDTKKCLDQFTKKAAAIPKKAKKAVCEFC
ncbi:MAG: hypothetical protein HY369_03970 [Candidatus Aenigmarchaeota archaeon]|nr:hypothetical protein [Candidatus Aenigmarchaeota archaeon]